MAKDWPPYWRRFGPMHPAGDMTWLEHRWFVRQFHRTMGKRPKPTRLT